MYRPQPLATISFAFSFMGQIISHSLAGGYDGPGAAAFKSAWMSLSETPLNAEPAPVLEGSALVYARRRNRLRFRRKLRAVLVFFGIFGAITVLASGPSVVAQADRAQLDASSPIDLLVSSGNVASQAISDSVDIVWNEQLPLLMTSVAFIATVISLASLVELIMEMINEDRIYGTPNWTRLLFPLVIASLIGSLIFTSAVPVGIRNAINKVNQEALESIGFAATFQQAKTSSSFGTTIGQMFERCNNGVVAEQAACFQDAAKKAQELLDAEAGALGGIAPWIRHWTDKLQRIGEEIANNPLGAVGTVQLAILSPAIESAAFFILNALQVAFQMLMEVALILTALLFPLALARGIATDGETVSGWAYSMFQVGMVKFFFNLIAGISSLFYLAIGGVGSGLWFALFTGLLAPFLAFEMVRGGGLGVLSTILAVASSVANIGLKLRPR
jgi:hypothetical protein